MFQVYFQCWNQVCFEHHILNTSLHFSETITPLLGERLHWLICLKRVQLKRFIETSRLIETRQLMAWHQTTLSISVFLSPSPSPVPHYDRPFQIPVDTLLTRSKNTKYGDGAFLTSRPTAWNSLPASIGPSPFLESFTETINDTPICPVLFLQS